MHCRKDELGTRKVLKVCFRQDSGSVAKIFTIRY